MTANTVPFFRADSGWDAFKVFFDQSPDGSLILSDGMFVECNPAAVTMLGYPDKSCIIGKHPLALSPSVQADGVPSAEKSQRMMAIALREGSCRFDWLHTRADGADIWVEVVLTRLFFCEKELLHVAWRDAVEKKRTQQALESRLIALDVADEPAKEVNFCDLFDIESIQSIQDAFAQATGVASIITLPDGTPITRPSNFCRLCNDVIRKTERGFSNCCKSDAAIGKYNEFAPIIQPCLSGGLWDAGSSITVGGRHVASWLIGQVRNEELDEENILKYADVIGADRQKFADALREVPVMSKERFEKISRTLFLFASELSQKAFLNVQQARTIRKNQMTEAALRDSEERFRALFQTMTEGVALHDVIYNSDGKAVDYRLIMVNPAYTRHTGLSLPPHGENLATQIYGTDEPPYLDVFAKVASTGEPYSFELFFVPLNRHFSVSVISPRIGQFATVFEDITDRLRKNKELQEKNEEMSRFTYAVSHDLKSPLVTIMTFLGYLKQDILKNDSATIEKDLGFINKAAEKMSKLLDELLQLSRIGRKINPHVEMALSDVVHDALDIVAGRIAAKQVQIKESYGKLRLVGDRPRITEVFQNLIDNAVKYMSDRSDPLIEIGHEIREFEIIIFVRDNGIGVDSRHLPKLFGLFEKLNPGTEGTGIGLALVKRIIEVHGGRIWVESEGPGKGSIFRLTFPGIKIVDEKQEE